MTSTINPKGIIFYIIIGCVIAVVILYFLPINGNPVTAAINGLITKLNLPQITLPDLNGIFEWIKNNSIATGVLATVGTTAFTYFIKNYQTNKLLDDKIAELNEAKIKVLNTEDTAKTLSDKLKLYEQDVTADELQKTLSAISGEKSELETKIKGLEGQIESLSKQPAQLAESLWAKSGGQTIEVGGVKYRIIEKETVTVK